MKSPRRRRRAAHGVGVGGIAVAVYVGFILSGVLGHEPRPRRSFGVAKLVGVALAAFGFAFSLVPLYRIACEKVFGIRLEQGPPRPGRGRAVRAAERW
jgi:hypothetical protein